MESSLVVKVKHGDTLRRFHASVDGYGHLDLDICKLRAKICSLFNFPPEADLKLTYVDEDGDVVSLVDDDDLSDVTKQCLKFLMIDVRLNNENSVNHAGCDGSFGSSSPLRRHGLQYTLPNGNNNVSAILDALSEPSVDSLSKLTVDLASKAASSSPLVGELVDSFSRILSLCKDLTAQSPSGVQSGAVAGASNVAQSGINNVNTAKDGSIAELQKKSSMDSTSKTSKGIDISSLGREARVAGATSVDLNLEPPCEPNSSVCTSMGYNADASKVTSDKETKKTNCQVEGKAVDQAISSITDTEKVVCWGSSSPTERGGNPFNECPFSGVQMGYNSPAPSVPPVPAVPLLYRPMHPLKRSHNHGDSMGGMFHRGVRCDGCGVHPITGPRYKSKVREDYDLCSICFAEMGNDADYIRLDRPMCHNFQRPFRGMHDIQNAWGNPPSVPSLMRGCGMKPGRPKLDSCFVVDVNVIDGTVMAPSTPFTKIWRMRNSGNTRWPQGTRLVWIGGDRFSNSVSVQIEAPAFGVPLDGEIDIAVDFTSPEPQGRYMSYWRMASPSGQKFGQRVWVLIQVDASLKEEICGSFQGLNLNLPPDGSESRCPEVIDVNAKPVASIYVPNSCSPNSVSPPVESKVDGKTMDQEKNIHLPSTVQYPVIPPPQTVQYPVIPPPQTVHYPFIPATENLQYPPPQTVQHPVTTPPQTVQHPVTPPHSDVQVPVTPSPSTVQYPVINSPEAGQPLPMGSTISNSQIASQGVSDNNDVEQILLKELEEMGFKQVDLNKEILRMNEYNLEQCVDDLCGVDEWDPILEELEEMGFCDKEKNKMLLRKNNGSIKRVVMDLINGEKA